MRCRAIKDLVFASRIFLYTLKRYIFMATSGNARWPFDIDFVINF
jgi:hypothetical protein